MKKNFITDIGCFAYPKYADRLCGKWQGSGCRHSGQIYQLADTVFDGK